MDFSWLLGVPEFAIDYLVQIVLAFAVVFLLPHAYRLLQIKADDSRRKLIEDAIQNGLKWAIAQMIAHAASGGGPSAQTAVLSRPENRKVLIANAAKYVKDGAPSALKGLHVDDALLEQRIEARLPEAANDALDKALAGRLL